MYFVYNNNKRTRMSGFWLQLSGFRQVGRHLFNIFNELGER